MRIATALLLVPLLAIAASVRAEETFTGDASVVLVEVPVQVIVDGKPLAGLDAASFELYDRGVLQRITGFEAYDFRGGREITGEMTAAEASLPELQRVRRNLLFLFDFAYPASYDPVWGAGHITAAVHGLRENAIRFRELVTSHLGDDDRWAIALFSPLRGMKLLQGWTTDPDEVRLALDVLEAAIVAKPREVEAAWATWQSAYPPADAPPLVESAEGAEADQADEIEAEGAAPGAAGTYQLETDDAVAAAIETGQLTTDDAAADAVEATRPTAEDAAPDANQLRVTLDELVREASTAAVRADPYLPHAAIGADFIDGMIELAGAMNDVAGPKNVVYLSVGFVSAGLRALETLYREYRRLNWTIQSVSTGGAGYYADSLRIVARETGGQAYFYSHDLTMLLEEMLDHTAVSYVLSFQPENLPADGKYHRLRVKLVDGPKGARVLYRRGYFAPEPQTAEVDGGP